MSVGGGVGGRSGIARCVGLDGIDDAVLGFWFGCGRLRRAGGDDGGGVACRGCRRVGRAVRRRCGAFLGGDGGLELSWAFRRGRRACGRGCGGRQGGGGGAVGAAAPGGGRTGFGACTGIALRVDGGIAVVRVVARRIVRRGGGVARPVVGCGL